MFTTLALVGSILLPQAAPSASLALFRSESIPNCSLVAEHYWPPPADRDKPRELWLRATNAPERRTLLATYVRDADVVFSPDCSAVALNDYVGSNIAEVRLFRRVGNGAYEPLPVKDPTGTVWRAIMQRYRIGDLAKWLNHTYVGAVAWSADSQALLLRLRGHTDLRDRLDDWYCVYDVATNRVSLDLSVMNGSSVYLGGRLQR
jgi:hypothetical protein